MPTPPPETPVDTSPEVAAGASEVIGIDIGGTKTHGIRWSGGAVVAEARTGSANVQNVSGEEAASSLGELFAALGGGVARVVVGAGGVDTDDDADALRRLIAPHAPGASIDIVHDTRLILAVSDTDALRDWVLDHLTTDPVVGHTETTLVFNHMPGNPGLLP